MDTPNTPTAPAPADDEAIKKYIRTYAGDMEIAKKGGKPELKALEPTPKEFKETIPFIPSPEPPPPVETLFPRPPEPPPIQEPPIVVVEEPPPPEPSPVPPPEPEPLPPPPSYREPVPEPVRPPPPIQFPEPTTVNAPEVNATPLETYSGDFLDKVKDTGASTATVLAAEQDAGATPTVEAPRKTSHWKTILSIVGGLILLIAGGVGAYLGYEHYLVKTAPVVIAPTVFAPIFVDDKVQISEGTPAGTIELINASVDQSLEPNTIRLLYTENSTTTGNDIFSTLQFPAPNLLIRNIVSADSMAGIVNVEGTSSPFFILSVASYQDTFAGMLAWEPTMPSDMSALFPPYPSPVSLTTAATTTTATTTPKTKSKTPAKVATSTPPAPVMVPAFHDQVIDNHDARIYLDALGRSILVYGYWNQTTLVIARDPAAFTEILGRLATSGTQ
jgi:hypothetical protein